MKVYVLTGIYDYAGKADATDVCGVFSTFEKAEAAGKKVKEKAEDHPEFGIFNHVSIDTMELDKFVLDD